MSTWPEDLNGSMEPILKQSIEVAEIMKEVRSAMDRHSSSQPAPAEQGQMLTAADRCDNCGAAAVYRLGLGPRDGNHQLVGVLDLCSHHHHKNFPSMFAQGWAVIGGNPDLLADLGEEAMQHGQR